MKLRKVLNDPPADYFTKLAHVESNNNPLAKAKTSSAAGLYQFTEGTWNGLTKQLGLNYTLEDRFDPKKARQVVEAFTTQNERYLKNKLGRDPNEAELYLAHFSGMGGANKMLSTLQSDPNTSVKDVFSEKQIKANKSVFLNKDGSAKKVKDIYNWAAKKFSVEEFKEPQVAETRRNKFIEERPTVAIDNTRVAMPRLATPPINPTYTELPDVANKQDANLTEQQLRQILQTEKQNTEQRFLDAFSSMQQPQQEEYIPQTPVEDLSHLYNYIKLTD